MSGNFDGYLVKFFILTRSSHRLMKGLANISIDNDKFTLKNKGNDEIFFVNEFDCTIPEKIKNKIELQFLKTHSYKTLTLEPSHSNSNFGAESTFRVLVTELSDLFKRHPIMERSFLESSYNTTFISSTSPVDSELHTFCRTNITPTTTYTNISTVSCNSKTPPSMKTPSSVGSSLIVKTPSSLRTNPSIVKTPLSSRTTSGILTSSLRSASTSRNFTLSKTSPSSTERLTVPTSHFYGTPSSSRPTRNTANTLLRAVPKTQNAPKSLTQIADDYTTPLRTTPRVDRTISSSNRNQTKSLISSSLSSGNDSKLKKTAYTQKTASTSCMKDDDLQIEVVNLEEEEEEQEEEQEDYDSSQVSNQIEKTHKSLKNIGNSCYSNAVLQVLGCLDRFRKELLECEASISVNSKRSGDTEFLKGLTHLLRRLSNSNRKQSISPETLYEFRELCGKHLGEQFGSCDQQDASEFFNNLLDFLQSAESFTKSPAHLFRIENDQLIFCKCGASRNKTEVENMLTVSTGRSRNPSMRKVIGHFFVEEKVKIDCDSCKMKSRLAGRFVSIKHLPKYLAVSVRRYDFKNDSIEKVNSNIHINKNLFLKKLCYDSKANEAKDFCRFIRNASESPRKHQVIDNVQISTPRAALRSILQKGGAPMGSYRDDREQSINSRKRRMDDDSSDHFSDICSTISSPVSSRRRVTRNESFSSEPKILESEKTAVTSSGLHKNKKAISFQPLRTRVVQDLQCITRKRTTPLYIHEDIDSWKKYNLYRSCQTDLEVEPHIKSVEGDGNCLFRSLSWWIFCGNEAGHKRLRQRICDFILQHPDHFSCFLNSSDTLEEHVAEMREDSHWGTSLEISAAATLFNIVIFTYFESWKIFRPMFKMKNGVFSGKLKLNADQIDELISERGSIYIHNESNLHFTPAYAPKVVIEGFNAFPVEEFYVSPEHAMIKSKVIQSPVHVVSKDEADTSSDEDDKDRIEFRKEDDPMYTLVGIVSHHGPNVHSGHYTCFCFDNQLGVWLDCNDELIREVNEKTVLEQSAKSGYLFFYERRRFGDMKSFEKRRNAEI